MFLTCPFVCTCMHMGIPHDTMLVLYMLWPCVCLSVCLSQVGVLLKWLNIIQTTPHDSPGTLAF